MKVLSKLYIFGSFLTAIIIIIRT